MQEKPIVPAALLGNVHRIPAHYFVTPRQSGLPFDYFRTWKDWVRELFRW